MLNSPFYLVFLLINCCVIIMKWKLESDGGIRAGIHRIKVNLRNSIYRFDEKFLGK